jgi:hypothetical protein
MRERSAVEVFLTFPTMFSTYAAWVRGATDADVAIIQSAMNSE